MSTEYTIVNQPSLDKQAMMLSDGEAVDIVYNCPKCGTMRRCTWLHPDVEMFFPDDCCMEMVVFKPEGSA